MFQIDVDRYSVCGDVNNRFDDNIDNYKNRLKLSLLTVSTPVERCTATTADHE